VRVGDCHCGQPVRAIDVAARRQQQRERRHVALQHGAVARRQLVGPPAALMFAPDTNQSREHVGVAVHRGHVTRRQAAGVGAVHIGATRPDKKLERGRATPAARRHVQRCDAERVGQVHIGTDSDKQRQRVDVAHHCSDVARRPQVAKVSARVDVGPGVDEQRHCAVIGVQNCHLQSCCARDARINVGACSQSSALECCGCQSPRARSHSAQLRCRQTRAVPQALSRRCALRPSETRCQNQNTPFAMSSPRPFHYEGQSFATPFFVQYATSGRSKVLRSRLPASP
jgi:hypothetical protein